MLRTLLVDDELPSRDELRYLLSFTPDIQLVGEADNAAEAIAKAASLKPDVVFLDINMRDIDGMEAAAILRKIVPQMMIVFATAYDEYAIKAFEIGAIDYILKPFEQERIVQTVGRLQNYRQEERKQAAERVDAVLAANKIQLQKLPVEKKGKILLLNYSDIVYTYASTGSVTVVTARESFMFNGTLSELEEKFAHTNMLRVHKSYIANLDKVKEVVPWFKGTYWLKMEDCPEAEIPVSKSQIKEIKTILGLK